MGVSFRVAMKRITLKIDDEIYRKARLQAARKGKSVSSVVNDFLAKQASGQGDLESCRIAALDELYLIAAARGQARAAPIKPLTRDEIYTDSF